MRDDTLPARPPTRVFVSYAQDSESHIDSVRQLYLLLRSCGIDACLDLPAESHRQDWPAWILENVAQCDFIIVVASPAYKIRAEGNSEPDRGKGVQFEAAIIRALIYKDRQDWYHRILPVVLPGGSTQDIPLFLDPVAGSHYVVSDFSVFGAESLIRTLTNQPREIEPVLRSVPVLPPRPQEPADEALRPLAHMPRNAGAASSTRPKAAPDVAPDVAKNRLDSLELPDVVTPPVQHERNVEAQYEPVVGAEAAKWLGQLRQRAIESVESADFDSQIIIGKSLISADLELESLVASGYYLLGEGHRLKADLATDDEVRTRLLHQAEESYRHSIDIGPDQFRSMRGLARTLESQGHIGNALTMYERARAAAIYKYVSSAPTPGNGVSHEILRVTRHYAACITDSLLEAPSSLWAMQSRQLQLHGLVAESDELHRQNMPRFSATPRWTKIEWFMGLVLLAKTYQGVGDTQRAWSSLLHALDARLKLLDRSRPLNRVERANLHWWCRAAVRLSDLPPGFRACVEKLHAVVPDATPDMILSCTAEILRPIQPPWQEFDSPSSRP